MFTIKAFREDDSMQIYPVDGGVAFNPCDKGVAGSDGPGRHISAEIFFQMPGTTCITQLNLGTGPSDNHRVTVENDHGVRVEDWHYRPQSD